MREKTSIVPCGYHVLVKPDPIETTTASGLILKYENEDSLEASQIFGTLIAAGPLAWKDYGKVIFNDGSKEVREGSPWAQIGDRVSYAKFGGSLMEDPITKIRYVLLNDNDIKTAIKAENAE